MPLYPPAVPPYTAPPYTIPPSYTYPPYTIPPNAPSYTMPPGYTAPPVNIPTFNFNSTLNWDLSGFVGGMTTFLSILVCISNCLLCHCLLERNKKRGLKAKLNVNIQNNQPNSHALTPFSSTVLENHATIIRPSDENSVVLYMYEQTPKTTLPLSENTLFATKDRQKVCELNGG